MLCLLRCSLGRAVASAKARCVGALLRRYAGSLAASYEVSGLYDQRCSGALCGGMLDGEPTHSRAGRLRRAPQALQDASMEG